MDTVAGLEARGTCQYLQFVDLVEQLVARVAQVQSDLYGLKHAGGVSTAVHVECGAMNMEPVVPAPIQTPNTQAPAQASRLQAWAAISPPASALLDISNRTGGTSQSYAIAHEDIDQCLTACKSRRNLAARLAKKQF